MQEVSSILFTIVLVEKIRPLCNHFCVWSKSDTTFSQHVQDAQVHCACFHDSDIAVCAVREWHRSVHEITILNLLYFGELDLYIVLHMWLIYAIA